MQMIKHFNQTSLWVATEILSVEELFLRAKVLTQFILIAQKCREINNFNAIVEILSGIENAAVHRLQTTWKNIPPSVREIYQALKELISSSHNFKDMRNTLKNSNPPCLPYLGIFLTDLTFVIEGNSNNVNGLINFTKRKKIANVIRDIQQYQQVPFVFNAVPLIQNWILQGSQAAETDNHLYKLSLIREPRSQPVQSMQFSNSNSNLNETSNSNENVNSTTANTT